MGVHMQTSTEPVETDHRTYQVLTTANFAPRSKVFAWYVGGLNKQIEHHLFPKVAHVFYKKLSGDLQALCKKHDLPYVEFPTFMAAIRSHFKYLKKMGKS